MKSTLLFAMLSMLAFNSFAKDSAGILTAGSFGKSTLISIAGAPAQKIYSTLAMKGDFIKLNANTVGTLKSSPEISCLKISAVNAYECKLLISSSGNALDLNKYSLASKQPIKGSVEAGGMSDYTNVKIGGPAALLLLKSLTNAKTTSVRHGSSITKIVKGGSVTCTSSLEVSQMVSCSLSVSANGNVEADLAR